MLEVKFKYNVHGVRGETIDCGNVDTAATWEILDMQPEELWDGLTDITEDVVVMESLKMSQGKWYQQKNSH